MTFLLYLCIIIFIIVCLLLMLVILIQKGRGGGLSSAFGGAGGNTAFGSKTGDVLTWATSVIFAIFLLLAVALNLLANHVHEQRLAAQGVSSQPQQTQQATDGQAPPATVPDPGAQAPAPGDDDPE